MGSNARLILVPASCESIGHLAFADSEYLQAIFFENGELEFEEDFVEGCSALERIIAPDGSKMARWAEENGY